MKALIIGGNGFIGSHLKNRLLQAGWYVRVLDLKEEVFRKSLDNVENIIGDYGNAELLRKALDGIDFVFHLACSTIPKTSNEEIIFDIKSNLIKTVVLLHECVYAKIQRIIFLSSGGTVYGIPQNSFVSEKHPTNPICSYGITKLAIEKYLEMFYRLYGLDYVVLRGANIYGERQDPDGELGVIAVFLKRAAEGRTINIWGHGDTVRDFLYVHDLTEAFFCAATKILSERVFNIGSGQGLSLLKLIDCIMGVTCSKVRVEHFPSRKFDVPSITLDINRASQILGWKPKVSLYDGITRTSEWINQILNEAGKCKYKLKIRAQNTSIKIKVVVPAHQ